MTAPAAGRKPPGRRLEVQGRQRKLLEVVPALRHPRRFSRRLDGWEQQGDQDADDRDNHQEFNQRKTATLAWSAGHFPSPWLAAPHT
jgi:hypothetical protein